MPDNNDFSTSSKEPYPVPGDDRGDTSAFNALIGHALMNTAFRDELLNPETRASAVKLATGRDMTPKMSEAIDQAVASIDSLAGHFGVKSAAT